MLAITYSIYVHLMKVWLQDEMELAPHVLRQVICSKPHPTLTWNHKATHTKAPSQAANIITLVSVGSVQPLGARKETAPRK